MTAARAHQWRLWLLVAWLLLVSWLASRHALWRDEVRAYSLAKSGSNISDMLHAIRPEGHPALWYLLLRAVHAIAPYREILPLTALVIGIAAMTLFVLRAPLRPWQIALVLFSLFGVFDFAVVARNYGISALLMFIVAAFYPRLRNSLLLGLLLAILANTNVPSLILAFGFLVYRTAEITRAGGERSKSSIVILAGNAAILAAGAAACILIVYPPVNDAALSLNYDRRAPLALGSALIDGSKGFSNLILNASGWFPQLLLLANCLAFVRRPPALIAALGCFFTFKLFFYFVYPSAYRHEALFVVFLLALHWISVSSPAAVGRASFEYVEKAGNAAFALLLVFQSLDLLKPLARDIEGVPYSRSADAARIVMQPALNGAIIMADPDLMVEALPYYADNPLWLPRQQQFGGVFSHSLRGRERLSLEDLLADAKSLHEHYHRPIVILLHTDLSAGPAVKPAIFLRNSTLVTAAGIRQFTQSTRLVARLRPAVTDESYDLYVYRG